MNTRTWLAGLVVLVGVTAGSLAPATPAMATEGDCVKQTGEIIVYDGPNRTGPFYDLVAGGLDDPGRFFCNRAIPLENHISSAWNLTTHQVRFFFESPCFFTGPSVVVEPGAVVNFPIPPHCYHVG